MFDLLIPQEVCLKFCKIYVPFLTLYIFEELIKIKMWQPKIVSIISIKSTLSIIQLSRISHSFVTIVCV